MAPPPPPPPRLLGGSPARVHLVVVQHGLWGTPGNMAAVVDMLQSVEPAPGERLVVVNSDVNERRKTHEGIDTCGERTAALVLETTAALRREGHRVAKVSMVGYSLGGMILRCAARRRRRRRRRGRGWGRQLVLRPACAGPLRRRPLRRLTHPPPPPLPPSRAALRSASLRPRGTSATSRRSTL